MDRPASSGPTDQDFELVDRLLDELMVKHLEMASLLGEYRDMIEEAKERPWDGERRNLVRNLPGARYSVAATFTREQAKRIEGELRRMFADTE
jgi:hypothetical protein